MCDHFKDLKISSNSKNILHSNNFINLTEIQKKVIPVLLSKTDIIAQSSTGSGKTLGFVIPLVENIKGCDISALIISPTRELATQTLNVVKLFTQKASLCIGGTNTTVDLKVEVVVGTPGRLLTVVKQNPRKFSKINFLILDEADRLLDMGFKNVISEIVRHLPSSRITGLFSATIDDSVASLSRLSLRNPITVKLSELVPNGLKIEYVVVKPFRKLELLIKNIQKYKSLIVFFSTCAEVVYFYELVKKMSSIALEMIHGKMTQEERFKSFESFSCNSGILFCTDVAARGLDFKNVEMVIHFSIPIDPMNILHRSGRSARNGNKGNSLLFLMENERKYVSYLKIKKIEIEEIKSLPFEISYKEIEKKLDPEIKALGLNSFISFVRSYKEHSLSILLSVKELNFDSLVALYFLDKIPGMDEIRSYNFKRFPKPERNLLTREERVKKYKEIAKKRKENKNKTLKRRIKQSINRK